MKLKEAYNNLINEIKPLYELREARSISLLIFREMDFSSTEVMTGDDKELEIDEVLWLRKVCDQLKKRIPVQYIIGYTWFMDSKFHLNPDVLIPRKETEELTDMIIRGHMNEKPSILDIGTGSGCIAVSLSRKIPGAVVQGSDKSPRALETAVKNARENNVNVNYILDDVLDPKHEKYLSHYDIIVSNPPYVRESEKAQMHPNVLDHEPHIALFVEDSNPLIFYKAIEKFARKHLRDNGYLYLEINENLGPECLSLFISSDYHSPELIKDMQKKNRFIKVRKQ